MNPTRLASGRPGRTRDMTLPPQADLRGSLLWAIMIASATHTADAMTGACQWWGATVVDVVESCLNKKLQTLKQRERPPAVARAWAFVEPSLQVGNFKGRAVKFRHLHRASRSRRHWHICAAAASKLPLAQDPLKSRLEAHTPAVACKGTCVFCAWTYYGARSKTCANGKIGISH